MTEKEDVTFVGRAEDYRLCEKCGRNFPIKEIAGKCQFPECGVWLCLNCSYKCGTCNKIFCKEHARILEEKYLEEGETKGKIGCHICHPVRKGCFIATACYGIDSEEVNIFRSWRDNKLLKSQSGRNFVNFYYKISPPLASFISNKPILKKVIRIGLHPIKEKINTHINQLQPFI